MTDTRKPVRKRGVYLPMLSADPASSLLLYIVSAAAMVAFGILAVFSAKDLLQNGGNLSPIHVRIENRGDQQVAPDIAVAVVTPWSQMQLIRNGDVWSLPEGQVRAVPEIVVTLPNGEEASAYDFYVSTGSLAANAISQRGLEWERASITFLAANPSTCRLNVIAPASLILGMAKRSAINWRGDLKFLAAAAVVPFTRVFFCWLWAAGFLWFNGAIKATSAAHTDQDRTKTGPDGSRVDGLDYIRGIAILMVYAYHCLSATFGYDQLGWDGWFRNFDHDSRTFLALAPVTFGFGGVAVFFAMSGFCIHLSYQRSSDKSWFTYLWRRLFRIYPPYLFALLFFALAFPATRLTFEWPHELTQFYTRIFLIFNLDPSTLWFVNGSFWSVAVEIQLYLVYPILLIAARRAGWRTILWIAFLVEIGLKFPSSELSFLAPNVQCPFALQMGPFGYVFSWLIGAKLADDFLAGRALIFRRVPMLVWCSLLTVSLTFKPAAAFQFVLFSLTTVGIIARCVEGKSFPLQIPRCLKNHVAWVGAISYSVYLLHQPFLNLAPKFVRWMWSGSFVHPIWQLLSCAAVYPLILTLSWLMYRYIELPSIAAGKWFLSRQRPASLTARPTMEATTP